ncbi:50S ribosomal protein L32 [Acaryochloris thomasi RCC1774]|uniref:Large ribosomal subunit protein bL32 n=1 Tax=Acaryochloris thomasi RCC1774 TaxID=1764569 RepID=A0A2W1JZD0_9CYAN|nr:50S ribosomal protein L32 [Acaryochloris thomasi]PZD75535.1 50S ribosomal protein L32 [Acaryochloris thomasi RCC1774]
MAVPKKKTSNSKRNSRRAHWNRKANLAAQRAMSTGKSILSGRAKGFYYPVKEDEDDEK